MLEFVAIAGPVLGFIVPAVLFLAQRSLLRRGSARAHGHAVPPVSVLRPLRGLDSSLEDNLVSLFRQDHPCYEVLLGAADADDPALEVARRVAAANPHVPSRVVADARRVGANPKVSNLANLARRARHDVLVVSDSNVAVPRGWLGDVASRLSVPGTALVSSPIRARPSGTLGAALESLRLNTFVMGGAAAVSAVPRGVCCVGKSMAFRRADLDAVGGFPFLGAHLAEDQVAAEEMARSRGRVVIDATPVDNVLGPLTLRDACARHLRWARIRRRMAPLGYAAEVLANPVALALAAFAALPAPTGVAAAAAILAVRALADAAMERRLGVVRPAWTYLPLLVLSETLALALWPVPFVSARVAWRGHRFVLGARTRLEPVPRTPAPRLAFADAHPADPIAATA